MTYSYNDQNNITSIKTFAYQVTTGTPQNEKRMFYHNAWKDQLTKIEYYVNGSLSYFQTLTYDASGNVTNLVDSRTSYANKSYQWEGRQLSNYSSYCNTLSFKYNDQGLRTQKLQGTCSGLITTNYTLDGDRVLVEHRSNGITLSYTYDIDGTLLSMNYNGTEYFYITNMQGDIIELVDIGGNSVVKYKYDAWGNIISQTGGSLADINPYRYRGYRYDVETGLYYLQSRYYDPAIGRFISADGLLGETGNLVTHNMYAYCGNNPVMYTDITGFAPEWIKLAIGTVAITVLVAVTVAAVVASGGTLLIPVLIGAGVGACASIVGQGVGNVLSGQGFFDDLSIESVLIGAVAGAAFASGFGGFFGAIGIGSLSNGGLAAIQQQSWGSIGIGTLVGGFAAGVGYGLGKFVSNQVFKNSDLVFNDIYRATLIDANHFVAATVAIRSTYYTFIPSATNGVAKGIINYLNRLRGE